MYIYTSTTLPRVRAGLRFEKVIMIPRHERIRAGPAIRNGDKRNEISQKSVAHDA